MSIWDHMRKAARPPAPQSIDRLPDGALSIRWDDAQTTRVEPRALRLGCPCAVCVDEMTGARLLDPERVPQDVGIKVLEPVGNYAVRIVFSDAHETGLFDWTLLRKLSS
ncbi:MAG: DUF971 domain-containing protein [Deltaproteobacteria bacterium]|nr:DUF971 domain-containing protein [Deltaproteobacteria bacterium]